MIVGLGLVVVGVVAWLCPRFGRIGGAVVGFACGLLPSALILTLAVIFARHNLYEVVGTYAVAAIVAIPSAIAGALAGIICSQHEKTSLAS
jgi:hypothetical protein